MPWHGYDLGEWTEEFEQMAERATNGDYWRNGELNAQRRRSDVAMNTEVRTLDDNNKGRKRGDR
jgi:4-hydroxy-3-polyprenylbenzoate decarboxylase